MPLKFHEFNLQIFKATFTEIFEVVYLLISCSTMNYLSYIFNHDPSLEYNGYNMCMYKQNQFEFGQQLSYTYVKVEIDESFYI